MSNGSFYILKNGCRPVVTVERSDMRRNYSMVFTIELTSRTGRSLLTKGRVEGAVLAESSEYAWLCNSHGSRETRKLTGVKSNGKTACRRMRTGAAGKKVKEKKKKEKESQVAPHKTTGHPFSFGERCPETFKATTKAIRNPTLVARNSANFTSDYFDRG